MTPAPLPVRSGLVAPSGRPIEFEKSLERLASWVLDARVAIVMIEEKRATVAAIHELAGRLGHTIHHANSTALTEMQADIYTLAFLQSGRVRRRIAEKSPAHEQRSVLKGLLRLKRELEQTLKQQGN